MDRKETYYLMPGNSVGRKGLPGGILECKKGAAPLKIEEKYFDLMESVIDYQRAAKTGKILIASELKAKEEAEEAEKAATGKSEKRLALEAEAAELGIEFTDSTSQKKLKELIDAVLPSDGDAE